MLLGKLPRHFDLGLGDVPCEQARNAKSGLMDVHHDGDRVGTRQIENGFEDPDDEFLRGVIVVVNQHPPHARRVSFVFGAGARDYALEELRLSHNLILRSFHWLASAIASRLSALSKAGAES